MICESCGKELEVGGWPYCPHDKVSHNVITDEIPGGVWIRHGICNEDGTPRKYYSKSEMVAEAKRRGLVNLVEHVPEHGSDKSRHTVRWISVSPISEEDRLKAWWADEEARKEGRIYPDSSG